MGKNKTIYLKGASLKWWNSLPNKSDSEMAIGKNEHARRAFEMYAKQMEPKSQPESKPQPKPTFGLKEKEKEKDFNPIDNLMSGE